MVNKVLNLNNFDLPPCTSQNDEVSEHEINVETQILETPRLRGQKRMKEETIVQKNVANLKAVVDPKPKVTPIESVRKAEEIVIEQLRKDNKISSTDIDLLRHYRDLEKNRPLVDMGSHIYKAPLPPVGFLQELEALLLAIKYAIIQATIDNYTEAQRDSYRQARGLIENEFVRYACGGLDLDGKPGGEVAVSRMADVCIQGASALKESCIGFINGMANEFTEAEKHALNLCTYAQTEIKLVYDATHGVFEDVLGAAMSKANDGGPLDINERLLLLQWEDFFATHGPDAKFHQICHSKGACHVKNALRAASQDIRDRIVVSAFAPASIILPDECLKVNNFASEKDTWLLEMHKKLSPDHLKHLEILKASELAEGHDHSFASPTYQDKIMETIKAFNINYGEDK